MLKQGIYTAFVKRYHTHFHHPLFKISARFLQALFGLITFSYGGLILKAGPVGFLDRQIIRGENINALVTSAVKQYLSAGGVFLDVGANHGVLSLLAASNPQVTVLAFEPSTRELQRFRQNLALNPRANIKLFAYGLGEKETQQTLVLTSVENPGKNSLPAIRPHGQIVTCQFAPLHVLVDEQTLQQVRVCKLDVEGQEMFILHSLRDHLHLLTHCVFVVEISPELLAKVGFNAQAIYQFFTDAGYVSLYDHQMDMDLEQWDDVFYHPRYVGIPVYSREL
jgi:FkbM family methyltransferase